MKLWLSCPCTPNSSNSSLAAEALQRIGMVYQIEERIRGLTATERVRALRDARVPPMDYRSQANSMTGVTVESQSGSMFKADHNQVQTGGRPSWMILHDSG